MRKRHLETQEAGTGATAEFDAVARACGHTYLRQHPSFHFASKIRVDNIEGLQRHLCHVDEATKQARLVAFEELSNRKRLWQGVHDRGEAYIFASGTLAQGDHELMAEHFPARLKAVSIARLTLEPGEVLDLSTHPDEWAVGHREELYLLINIDRCSIGRGAKLVVRGNVASILIQCLITAHGPDEAPHIEILGTPFPVDTRITGPLDGDDGLPGGSGHDGAVGATSRLRHTMFGSFASDAIPLERCNGADGEAGQNGGNGRRGRTGGMCKTAEITVRHFLEGSGVLRVHAEAGRGGNGGNGGHAGPGGQPGAPGIGFAKNDCLPRNGQAGRPGNGGNGGNGGHGGNGGISSIVFITCPAEQANLVRASSRPSPGGCGGKGGQGGLAGMPDPTSSPKQLKAKPGKDGIDGIDGRSRPPARIYVNERLTT
ncbi:hypothetical protein [Ensifer sp. YR511]|uniref:hypothetical protein n=1 Tax=Ensifer sp. YR511 TaxID=1855294 RepID=UPI00088D7A57|nr:hypothetical protein [Ensifer sp. YR511]SDN97156.1 hypothetical protein SAMN05216328_14513 [Ensifer sp. YR511]